MGVEAMTLSTYLDRLEALDLVRRSPDPADRRAKLVEVTDLAHPAISFVALAEGFGVPGRNVTTGVELVDALAWASAEPGHRSTAVDGLYYTGSATNPGVGVPICLISGEHTATCVRADLP